MEPRPGRKIYVSKGILEVLLGLAFVTSIYLQQEEIQHQKASIQILQSETSTALKNQYEPCRNLVLPKVGR